MNNYSNYKKRLIKLEKTEIFSVSPFIINYRKNQKILRK